MAVCASSCCNATSVKVYANCSSTSCCSGAFPARYFDFLNFPSQVTVTLSGAQTGTYVLYRRASNYYRNVPGFAGFYRSEFTMRCGLFSAVPELVVDNVNAGGGGVQWLAGLNGFCCSEFGVISYTGQLFQSGIPTGIFVTITGECQIKSGCCLPFLGSAADSLNVNLNGNCLPNLNYTLNIINNNSPNRTGYEWSITTFPNQLCPSSSIRTTLANSYLYCNELGQYQIDIYTLASTSDSDPAAGPCVFRGILTGDCCPTGVNLTGNADLQLDQSIGYCPDTCCSSSSSLFMSVSITGSCTSSTPMMEMIEDDINNPMNYINSYLLALTPKND